MTATITPAVTIREKTTVCANSSAACKLKNRLRLLAQWSMCEARAAVSVVTKSTAGLANRVGVVNVVMVCSGCVMGGNLTALYAYSGRTFQS